MNTLGTILILSLTAIVIAIFIVLFVAYYNKKQSKQKMELQAKEVELQQSLLLNSLEVQEAEQKRIARD
ncbi:MAG: signal transduction histidine kinase, partial [Spirosomataceae bacterium]